MFCLQGVPDVPREPPDEVESMHAEVKNQSSGHMRSSALGAVSATEQLHFDFSLSCIGEGNGCPLQCSCLENPRDGGAWWAAIYGVTHWTGSINR